MSSSNYDRILVVTNGLESSEPTHQTAMAIARQHRAEVVVVDTLRPPSLFSRWCSPYSQDLFESLQIEKFKALEEIAERFRAAGCHDVRTELLLGKSSSVITRLALEWDASLVVRYLKGEHSKFAGAFGNTARKLMRICPAPVLLVRQPIAASPQVVACLDTEHGDAENLAILQETAKLAGHPENLAGLFCWDMYGRDLVKHRMNDGSFQEALEYTRKLYQDSVDEFKASHDLSVLGGGFVMENGDPSRVIPRYCRDHGVDVVGMCSATLHHPFRRYFGSTLEAVLDHLPCNLLAVKPIGFVSPLESSMKDQVEV